MIGRFGFTVLAVVAVATPAGADERSEALLRQYLQWVDASPAWTATSNAIRSEGADTFAEGVVLSREQQPIVEIKIERLRARDLAERDGGGFSASEIELTNGALASDPSGATEFEYSVPSASITGVSMPSFSGFAFDSRRFISSLAAFYALASQGEIADITIPLIVGSIGSVGAESPGSSRVEYQNVRASGLNGGVFTSQQAGPIVATQMELEGESSARIDSISVENLDLAGFVYLFDKNAYANGRGDGVWHPLASAIRFAGFSGNGSDGATFALAEFAIEGIDGRQPARPFTDEWDRLLDPAFPQEATTDLALDALTRLASASRAGTVRLNGFSIEAPEDNSAISLASMSFAALSSDSFDSFTLGDFVGSGPDFAFSLKSLEVADFVFPDLAAMLSFAAIEPGMDLATHGELVRSAFAGLPRLSRFEAGAISIGLTPEQLISIAGISLDLGAWNEMWAGSIELHVDDLAIPDVLLKQDPTTAPFIEKLGLDNLTADISLTDQRDPEEGTDNLTFGFAVHEVFDVGFSYAMRGFTTDWLVRMLAAAAQTTETEDAALTMLSGLTLEHAEIRATDHSLLDRGFELAAEMQGLNVEGAAYRQQMRGALPFLLSTVIPSALAQQLSPPLQAFLDGGQTLVADFSPETPVAVLDLIAAAERDPMTLPTLLGMEVRSEAAAP